MTYRPEYDITRNNEEDAMSSSSFWHGIFQKSTVNPACTYPSSSSFRTFLHRLFLCTRQGLSYPL